MVATHYCSRNSNTDSNQVVFRKHHHVYSVNRLKNPTPARDSLQDAKLQAGDGPEGKVGAPSVAAHRPQLCNCCQVVVHDADVADLAAGAVCDKHEDQQDDEDDHCRGRDTQSAISTR